MLVANIQGLKKIHNKREEPLCHPFFVAFNATCQNQDRAGSIERDSVWLIFIIHLVRGLNIVVLDIPLTSYDRFSIWQLAGKVVSELGFIKMNGTTLHDYIDYSLVHLIEL